MHEEQTLREQALATTGTSLRRAFDGAGGLTVGLEEELMLLHPATLELRPCAETVLERLEGDPRFKRELPAAQVEIATAPAGDVPAAIATLAAARRDLAAAAGPLARLAGAGVHPTSPGEGVLSDDPHYDDTRREYGAVAARQLVFALQVHVAVGGAERTLAVYNGARSYLPLIAALAANAPLYEGRDTGLASVRPKLSELLPRQGIPPALESWEGYAAALRWRARARFAPSRGSWWWELRPHPAHGTLEFRVPDTQSSLAEAGAVAALIQALAAWLAERHDAGEPLPAAEVWRIEENRWSACRYGVEGEMADLATGEPRPTREWLRELLAQLEPHAERLGAHLQLAAARRLAERNGAILQREAARGGPRALLAWLGERFLHGGNG